MRKLAKTFIVLFSEFIWIYYIIPFFTKVKWGDLYFVDFSWWILAIVSGYVINRIFAGKIHYIALIILNIGVLLLIIIQNWLLVLPRDSIIYGVSINIALVFFYLRSANLVFKEPSRMHMLLHFEWNVIIYILLSWVFSDQEIFHVSFLFAIFISLIGMVFTLEQYGEEKSNVEVEVQKVGNAGWFSAMIALLIAIVTFSSFLLFLPSLRHMLLSLGESSIIGLKWLWNQVISFLIWLSQFLPETETTPMILEEQNNLQINEEIPEEMIVSVPIEWLIAGAVIVGLIIVSFIVWLATRFLKRWKPPKIKKVERKFIYENSWWKQLLKQFRQLFYRLLIKWRKLFSRYYKEKIYWYFEQIERWGKKNGIVRTKSETSKEFIGKIIHYIHEQQTINREAKVELINGLRMMNEHYQATYYGSLRGFSELEYKRLIKQLKELKIKKYITQESRRWFKVSN